MPPLQQFQATAKIQDVQAVIQDGERYGIAAAPEARNEAELSAAFRPSAMRAGEAAAFLPSPDQKSVSRRRQRSKKLIEFLADVRTLGGIEVVGRGRMGVWHGWIIDLHIKMHLQVGSRRDGGRFNRFPDRSTSSEPADPRDSLILGILVGFLDHLLGVNRPTIDALSRVASPAVRVPRSTNPTSAPLAGPLVWIPWLTGDGAVVALMHQAPICCVVRSNYDKPFSCDNAATRVWVWDFSTASSSKPLVATSRKGGREIP
jgi:hypothetical protein